MSLKRLTVSAITAAGFVAAGPAVGQTTLTLSAWVPPQHLLTRAMVDWAKEVEKANIPAVNADAAFLSALQAKVGPLEQAWFRQASEKGLEGQKVLAEFRADIKRIAGGK